MLLTVVALSLGIFALVNLLKLLSPAQIEPAGKLLLVVALTALTVPWFAADALDVLLLGFAVYGLSTVFHGVHKLLEAAGDERRGETLVKGLRR